MNARPNVVRHLKDLLSETKKLKEFKILKSNLKDKKSKKFLNVKKYFSLLPAPVDQLPVLLEEDGSDGSIHFLMCNLIFGT